MRIIPGHASSSEEGRGLAQCRQGLPQSLPKISYFCPPQYPLSRRDHGPDEDYLPLVDEWDLLGIYIYDICRIGTNILGGAVSKGKDESLWIISRWRRSQIPADLDFGRKPNRIHGHEDRIRSIIRQELWHARYFYGLSLKAEQSAA